MASNSEVVAAFINTAVVALYAALRISRHGEAGDCALCLADAEHTVQHGTSATHK